MEFRNIPLSYYSEQMKYVQTLNEQVLQGQTDMIRTVLSLQSILLGVLVALLPPTIQAIGLRWLGFSLLLLLLLGCLLSAVVLYDLTCIPRRAKEALLKELRLALKEDREMKQYELIYQKKRTTILILVSLALLLVSLILLLALAYFSLFVS